MLIKDIFQKEIDRNIQGVIIVGQDETANVHQELEEYVVTRELQKHFADFFKAYKKGVTGTTSAMGVWISGFFGSGKSHFLKILSYLLSNKQVGDKHAIDYFVEDKKIADPKVLEDMRLTAETPADVILFNIDAKSDSTSKENKDAILNVFLKVFNEMQGFCGSMPYLADLERHLQEEDRLEDFKATFEQTYGDTWENARQDFDFIQDDVVDVLTAIGFMSEDAARNWCEKATTEYRISIEEFAQRVKKYIAAKGDNHHVVFLADEIGQYIGEDSKLMLNLQTVTEELGKECKGKAWVVVTSQQDIDAVTKVKGNDFSKIQGRFSIRLALSSANVDEVIKKRVLEKTEAAAQGLRLLYEQKETVIKNLIVFNDSVEKKLYKGAADFAEVYPFIPYQFNLLGSVLTSIRTHGASGKHLSEGERSMLALFKESAMQIMDQETGVIVPFYRFYDALENFLDHSHRGVILRAYDNSRINPEHKTQDVFEINVLKTLFMIKYVGEIEANLENITSLMVDHVDNDRVALKKQVEKALKVLAEQMLIQKNGQLYIFLTNEEQEVNNEIEKETVEMSEVIAKTSEMIFEDIFPEKKYRYPEFNGRYTFAFNQKVDDRPYKANQAYDIGVNILTPWYDGGTDDQSLRLKSNQATRDVLVLLPNDAEFLREMQHYMKIERFLRKNTSTQMLKYKDIKEAKQSEMRERNENAKLYLTESLKNADIYVLGDKLNTAAKDVSARLNEGIGRMVITVYNKLNYIDYPMDDSDIVKLLKDNIMALKNAEPANPYALDDVLNYVAGYSKMHQKISIKNIRDHFTKAPYGFVEEDVNWLVACLFKQERLAFTVSGMNVTALNKTKEELFAYLTKRQYAEKLMIEERVQVPEKEKKLLRDIMRELFQFSAVDEDEDQLMRSFHSRAKDLYRELTDLERQYDQYPYPGKSVVQTGKKRLSELMDITEAQTFFKTVVKRQDDLYDFAEDYEPVKSFFGGEQKSIFEKVCDTLAIYNDSKVYIVNQELEEAVETMRRIIRNSSPYRDIPKLPELRETFNTLYTDILDQETTPVCESIKADRDRVLEVLAEKPYQTEKQKTYRDQFTKLQDEAERCNNVSTLRSYKDRSDALKQRLLREMDQLDEKLRAQAQAKQQEDKPQTVYAAEPTPIYQPKKTRRVSIRNITRTASWRLENPRDVDKCVETLRKALLAELDDNTILNIEI